MSRAPSTSALDTWLRTASFLLLGSICYALPWSVFAALPLPADNSSVLRIQGSNTIGARLGPALAKGLMEEQGLSAIRVEPGDAENEQVVIGKTAAGQRVAIEVAAHGSGTGFTALADDSADLAASSRPIKDSEAASLAALGDLKSPRAEQIIAIDGLAIILHPSNPLSALSTEQLAQIFAGEIRDWAQLGGPAGPISLYARDDKSGTFDTFKELVLGAKGKTLATQAKRFESSEKLSDAVSQDPNAIGFIGLPYIRQAKAVAIAAGDSLPMLPSQTLIATEDYPLSRRLFFYNQPDLQNPWAQALVKFAHSDKGQSIVEANGFIAQTVRTMRVNVSSKLPAIYKELAHQAQRLTVNFRFQEGSTRLDNKAQRDLSRLLEYLQVQQKTHRKVVLVGFGDPNASATRAEILSKWRAQVVRRELSKADVLIEKLHGFGGEMPVASNQVDEGRSKNRRVEVWVY